MIEVETQTTEVEVINNVEVTSTSQVEVETVDLSDLDITVAKKEYVITGDDIYIPMLYDDDAPQWMKDLVQVVVDVSISSGNQNLINDLNAMLQDFAVSYVPLNQYTQTILDLGNEDTRINALLETLNSNFNNGLSEANAQIISLQMTKASKDEVVAQVIQTIAAQLADGASNIGSTIGRIDQAIADETSARALSLQTLTASLEDTNLDIAANAEVIQNALAYVGIDEAGASTGTGLSAYLEDSNGNIGGADSQLANSIRVTAEGVESKFAYNSIVNINGVYKKSGFGLTTNYISGAGTQANPYVSEFWIDASRLKFTNSNVTGSVAPFTIDATGTTPEITFNGKVSFSNVTDVPVPSTSIISSNWTTGSGSTGIFSINGLATENYRVYADNHLGQRVIVWECRPDSASDPDGGWNTSSFEIDRTKTYRYSVFVKTSANTGTTHFGCGGNTVATLNTNTKNSNPYFWSGDLPTQNEWYLIVGYVYPSGQTGLTNKGGIYNAKGVKVSSIVQDFNWASDATTGLHRCYHYYDTVTTTRQWMWNPRVDLIDGNEPSILDLIGNVTRVEDISWQSEVQNAINNNATYIDGGKVVTNEAFVNNLNATGGIIAETVNVTSTLIDAINVQGGIVASSIRASSFTLLTDAGKNTTTSRTNSANCFLANNSFSISTKFYDYTHSSTSTYKFAKSVIGNLMVYSGNSVMGSGIQNNLSNNSRILYCGIEGNCTLNIYLRIDTNVIASGSIYVVVNGGTGSVVVGGITFYAYTVGNYMHVYCSSDNYCTASTAGYSGAFNILLSGFGMPTYSATSPILMSHHNI